MSNRVRTVSEDYNKIRVGYAQTSQQIQVGNARAAAQVAGYEVMQEMFRQNLKALHANASSTPLETVNLPDVTAALAAIEAVKVDQVS